MAQEHTTHISQDMIERAAARTGAAQTISHQDIQKVLDVRDHLPGFLVAIAQDNISVVDTVFFAEDNSLNIVYPLTFSNFPVDYRETLDNSSPVIKENFQSLQPEFAFYDEGYGVMSLRFPPEVGMTKDKLEDWLTTTLTTYRTGLHISVNGNMIEQKTPPIGDYMDCGNGQKCIAIATDTDTNTIYSKGIPVAYKAAPDGQGHLIFLEGEEIKGLDVNPDHYPILTDTRLLKTMDNLQYKIPGSGDVHVDFDPLSRDSILQSYGLSSMQDVTPEFIQGLTPEQLDTFTRHCLRDEITYTTPDIHVRDTLSMVQKKQEWTQAVDTRRTSLKNEFMFIVDMWTDACRKAVKAAGLSETLRIGILDTDPQRPSSLTKGEMQSDDVPLLLIDVNRARNMSSQEMLAEAVYTVSKIQGQIARQNDADYNEGRNLVEIFKKIPENDYLSVRERLRPSFGGCLIAAPITEIDTQGGRLSRQFMAWNWPEVYIPEEPVGIPEIPGSTVTEVPTEPSLDEAMGFDFGDAISLFEGLPLETEVTPTPDEPEQEPEEHIPTDDLFNLFADEPLENETHNEKPQTPEPGPSPF